MEELPTPRVNQIWVPRHGKAKPKLITHATHSVIRAVSYPVGISGKRRYPPGPTPFTRSRWTAWCEKYQAVLKESQP